MVHELEVRYRRLMAAYPWRYRREYEEEMVGVLMSEADPGQIRPSLRDRADLLFNAFAVRLRGVGGGLRDEQWRRAAAVMQLVGAMFLLAVTLRRGFLGFLFGQHWEILDVARPAAWAVTLTLALCGLRRLTAAFAAIAAAVEIVHVAGWYTFSPSQVLMESWLVVTALVVLAASVWRAAGAPVPRPRGLLWFGAAFLLAAGATVTDHLQDGYFVGGFAYGVTMDGVFIFRIGAPIFLVAAALLVWAWWRQGGPVRRRMVALAAPIAAIVAMVYGGFGGFMYSSQRFNTPVYLRGFQWVILAVTPVLAFALAALILDRYERITHLVALGRRAEA